jgi:hypothetical protein
MEAIAGRPPPRWRNGTIAFDSDTAAPAEVLIMSPHSDDPLHRLEPFIGEWSMEAIGPHFPPTDVRGRVTFEWLPGGGFLVERWVVPVPAAPDGLAVIGFHRDRGG